MTQTEIALCIYSEFHNRETHTHTHTHTHIYADKDDHALDTYMQYVMRTPLLDT